MGFYRVRGFPLEHRTVKENEAQLTLFSYERGRIRISVRGTKKTAGSLRPALLPLTEGLFYITERRTSDLLTEWAPLRSFSEMKRYPGRIGLAGYAGRYYLVFPPDREPDLGLYHILENIYLLFNTRINHDIMKVLFEWGFLHAAGLAPSLKECAGCGSDFTAGPVGWNIPEGDLYCGACRAGNSAEVQLSLKEMEYGKRIDTASRALALGPINVSDRALETELMELEMFGKKERGRFGTAAAKFCAYHLNEEVAKWHINI